MRMKKIILLLAILLTAFSVYGARGVEAGEEKFFKKLWNIDQKEIDRVQKLFKSVESNLTKIICQGTNNITITYSTGDEKESEEPLEAFYAFNDSYLFEKGKDWMLLATKKKGKWVNNFPKFTQLNIDEAGISWMSAFYNFPVGKFDMNKEFALGLDHKIYIENTSRSFSISRVTGKYFYKQRISYNLPGGEFPDFRNNHVLEGECTPMPEKRKF